MKNTFKFLAFIAISSLFAFSCQKNEVALEDEQPSEKIIRTITFEYPENADTKVSLSGTGITAWQPGDEILIHGQKMGHSGEEYYSRVVTLAADDIHNDGKTATLSFEDIIADKSWGRSGYKATMFAAYPASALKDVSGGTSWYYTSGFVNTQTLLLGGCNDTSVNDGNTFRFVNLTGVISFVVSGDFDSFVFSGNNAEVVDYDVFAVRIDTESNFGDKNAIPYSGGSGIKTSGNKTTISGPVVADGTTVNYIYLPGGANLSGGFTIKFLKEGVEQKRVNTNTAKNVAYGKYLNLGNITDYLHTYNPPATHDSSIDLTGATDLSASASANCYIVDGSVSANAGKVFTFKAYKGNSTIDVGTITSAEVLWETYNNSDAVTAGSVIAGVDYDKQAENDYFTMVFQMPSTLRAGNAVIAAKDKSDNILWSWHIWIPATAFTTDYFGVSSVKIMSRNLGALVDSETPNADIRSFGLYYQWGRKDPFVGYKWGPSGSETDVAVSGAAARNMSKSSTQMTIAQSVAAPTTIVAYKGDWLSAHDNTLWGNGAAKTIYDPCPAGYRVPAYISGDPMWKKVNTIEGFDASKTGYWWKLGTTVFPLAGCYDYDGGITHAYDRSWIWNSKVNDNEDYGEAQYIYDNSGSWASEPGWGKRKACAANVRCCVE